MVPSVLVFLFAMLIKCLCLGPRLIFTVETTRSTCSSGLNSAMYLHILVIPC